MYWPLGDPMALTRAGATGISCFSDAGLPVKAPSAVRFCSTTYCPLVVTKIFVGRVKLPFASLGNVVVNTFFDCKVVLKGTVLIVLVQLPLALRVTSTL